MLIPSVSKRDSSRSITLINQFNCKQIFSWHNKEINAIGFVCYAVNYQIKMLEIDSMGRRKAPPFVHSLITIKVDLKRMSS